MLVRRAQWLMSVPERLRVLAQSALWKIAGPLAIPYFVHIHVSSESKTIKYATLISKYTLIVGSPIEKVDPILHGKYQRANEQHND